MTGQQRDEQVIQAWNAHRPYLVDLAFRMLGDIGAAEDVVQDAFARLLREPRGEITDDRGWLDRRDQPAVPGPDPLGPVAARADT